MAGDNTDFTIGIEEEYLLVDPATRNLANASRARRHVNPWNYPVKVHTYEEYEDDFREKMIEAGLPVDIPLPTPEAEAGGDGDDAPAN